MRSLPEHKKTVISPVNSHYQSFPDVVLTRTGRLICVYREADAHVASTTRLLLRTSMDFGFIWSEPKELAKASISTDGYTYNCPRIVQLRDGRVLINCDRLVYPGRVLIHENEAGHQTEFWESADDGRTWSAGREVPGIPGMVPDRILELPDGTLLMGSHRPSPDPPHQLEQLVSISRDRGATWPECYVTASDREYHLCEGSFVLFEQGLLACFCRENSMKNHPTFVNFSDDGGRTWTCLEEMPFKGHRPVAGITRSGRLLITSRDVELAGGGGGRLLHPGAHAWLGSLEERDSGQVLVLDHDDSARPFGDCGYTGWVQRDDGAIFVVNYHKGDAHQPYIKGYWITEGDFAGVS
jgi:sialidase-1